MKISLERTDNNFGMKARAGNHEILLDSQEEGGASGGAGGERRRGAAEVEGEQEEEEDGSERGRRRAGQLGRFNNDPARGGGRGRGGGLESFLQGLRKVVFGILPG